MFHGGPRRAVDLPHRPHVINVRWSEVCRVCAAVTRHQTGPARASNMPPRVRRLRRHSETGPYNFGFADTRADWSRATPTGNGLLVCYSDGACTDNNTISHPRCGETLPVDARPAPVTFPDGVRQPSSAVRRDDRSGGHRRGELPSPPHHSHTCSTAVPGNLDPGTAVVP